MSETLVSKVLKRSVNLNPSSLLETHEVFAIKKELDPKVFHVILQYIKKICVYHNPMEL